MWNSLARGYRFALLTLAVEAAFALFLFSDSTAIFAIIAMIFVGVAWLPSSLMILADLRLEQKPGPVGFVVAIVCGLIGIWCLLFLLKSIATAMFM